MIVSRRWLEALLGGAPLDARDAAERLTAHVAAVDAVVPIHGDLGDIVIARVIEVKKHPNADRLSLCLVDAGGGSAVEVVCGAPNVRAGKSYPYAPVGAVLPGGVKLERKTIRGVESNGMLCSAKELGLGEDHAGIIEVDTSAAPGTRFTDVVPVADHQIVIDVPASRPDLLCHKGVARELGASLAIPVKLPAIPGSPGIPLPSFRRGEREGVVDSVAVRLEDPEGAPRYMIAVIRGVQVGESPAWLSGRLTAVGQRPINNVVDATNYVLLELNQPLHAFDLAKLRGPAVVVRRARPAEKIVTLDGVARTLTPEMTAICDAERPTIVAGVMGSAESEVSAATTDLVIECAYFQPTRIRRTRRALELSSESSYRFERGIDMLAMPDALRRAIELIVAVAGGELREPPLDLWPEPVQERTVFLRAERVSRLLGVAVARADIERYLTSVGFFVAPKEERLAVQVPGWRPDVTRDVDLIEEVARLAGYDAFPDELRPYRPGTVPDAPEERARALLGRVGYGPRPVGPQLVGERVIAREPRDLFDQVDVARHVGAPPGHLDREPLLLGRHEEPDRREVPLDVGARDRHAEQPGDALGAEEHRALLDRLGPEVERRLAQLAARHRDDELDRAPQRVRHGQHVDAPLEAVARLARQLERPSGTADARRLEVGALDHQVGRGRAHLGLRAPHDPRHDRRPLGVADRRHLRRQGARDAVEGHDLLGRPGAPHHDRGPPQLCEIERVQRLVQLEQDVVRRVHHVVDRPLADGGQPTREPGGALPHLDSPDDGDHVARGALGVL